MKNGVFAATCGVDSSPLNFMLGLMRDPNLPTDLRIEMATSAAPFVHRKPQAPQRVRTNPMDSSPIKGTADFTALKMDEELNDPEQGADGNDDLSPLNFLLSVMKDPDATAKQRIKAARIAARYKHAPVAPDKMPSVDEYGFAISRTLAKAIADDWWRLHVLEDGLQAVGRGAHIGEASQIRARQAERDEVLRCPSGYSAERDLKRRAELEMKRRRGQLTMAENTELAHVVARITASEASFNRTPEGRARLRIRELKGRWWMRSRDWPQPPRLTTAEEPPRLTTAEENELRQLLTDFPSEGPMPMSGKEVMALYKKSQG